MTRFLMNYFYIYFLSSYLLYRYMKFLEKLSKPYKILAPMVGNSELAYRMLARKYGADFCFTEMVNCEIFLKTKQNPISNMWYTTNELDRPLIIQICGHDELKMLQTSLILQNYCDAIDINLGCPQEIARKGYYGSFLQNDWITIKKIINTLSNNLNVPVTCKIRIFESIELSVKYAKMIEKAGAKMITVHGRTREQRGINTGFASWEHIKQIKLNVNIPVIANGGIIYSRHIDECIDYTNCDGIMVAETHLYNPLIFSTIKKSSLEIYEEFLVLHGKYKNKYDLKNIKSHSFKMLQVILKNKPELREELNKCKDLESFFNFYKFLKTLYIENKEYFIFEPYIR